MEMRSAVASGGAIRHLADQGIRQRFMSAYSAAAFKSALPQLISLAMVAQSTITAPIISNIPICSRSTSAESRTATVGSI